MKNLIKLLMVLALFMAGMQANATIITLSPGTEIDCGGTGCGGVGIGPGTSAIDSYITSTYSVTGLYKDNVGGSEEGGFLSSYETTFSNTASDPEDALIEYISGPTISCPECYLLVKDGNHAPMWYLFDIGSWDGVMDIDMQDFWPNGGAISHVSIYGGENGDVPEPGPLALLALGLIGVGLRRLKKAR
jgi:hypothetical protein